MVVSARDTATRLFDVVARVDEDDPRLREYLTGPWLGVLPWLQIVQGKRDIMTDLWNQCMPQAHGDILWMGNDDAIFRTKGWDVVVERAFAACPDKILLVHGMDGYHQAAFASMGFYSRRWFETVGYFQPPIFTSDFGDAWMNELANAVGRRLPVPFVIEHMHFQFGKAPMDQTYKDRLMRHEGNEKRWNDSELRRKLDIEKLRAVMDSSTLGDIAVRMSRVQAERNSIFSEFKGFKGTVPAGMDVHWTGAMFPSAWQGQNGFPEDRHVKLPLPHVNEEYFEWIDLLEAVNDAKSRGTFKMVELGAGYGRWGISGAMAAAQLRLASMLFFVEAEPQHQTWLREAIRQFANYSTDESYISIHDAAISYDADKVTFLTRSGDLGPASWYGQHVGEAQDGDESVVVPTTTLAKVLDTAGIVDLVDADLQGMELELVRHEMDVLNAKVRRIHIGTHGTESENEIRKCFQAAGWVNRWDWRSGVTEETPFGPVHFQDGVQSWRNPRL